MTSAATHVGYEIDSNKSRLNVDLIWRFLTRSYWAEGIPKHVVEKSIAGSDCFAIFKGNDQVGFARVISDHATFAYLADVFVLREEQGHGLAKWLVQTIVAHPNYPSIRRWMLVTRDAHGLYRQAGFVDSKAGRLMEILDSEVYKRNGATK